MTYNVFGGTLNPTLLLLLLLQVVGSATDKPQRPYELCYHWRNVCSNSVFAPSFDGGWCKNIKRTLHRPVHCYGNVCCCLQPSRCLFVVYLADTTTEDDLAAFAQSYGRVDSTRVIRDRETHQPKGFGFIYMKTIDDAWRVSTTCGCKAEITRVIWVDLRGKHTASLWEP